jgi:hypothetical protein
MFDAGCGSEAIADDPAAQLDTELDTELEDGFAWAAIERDLRQGGEDRTFGNTSPPGCSPWKSTPTPNTPTA